MTTTCASISSPPSNKTHEHKPPRTPRTESPGEITTMNVILKHGAGQMANQMPGKFLVRRRVEVHDMLRQQFQLKLCLHFALDARNQDVDHAFTIRMRVAMSASAHSRLTTTTASSSIQTSTSTSTHRHYSMSTAAPNKTISPSHHSTHAGHAALHHTSNTATDNQKGKPTPVLLCQQTGSPKTLAQGSTD